MSNIALPVRKSSYVPAELGEAHREIIRLFTLGASAQDIAAQMKCSRQHVRYVVNSPMGVIMRQDLQDRRDDKVSDVTASLADMCPKAIEVMNDVMEGDIDGASLSLRVRVCESVLDRAGYGKVTKTQSSNLTASLTAEDIIALQERATKEARAVGVIATI